MPPIFKLQMRCNDVKEADTNDGDSILTLTN